MMMDPNYLYKNIFFVLQFTALFSIHNYKLKLKYLLFIAIDNSLSLPFNLCFANINCSQYMRLEKPTFPFSK